MTRTTLAAVVILSAAPAAVAQPYFGNLFEPVNHWAWQENTGWTNWRWDPIGWTNYSVAREFNQDWLGRFVWAENIGWINLGDASPGTPAGYANLNGLDFGVNIQPDTGLTSGFAWSENCGWINFGPFPTLPVAQRPRLDLVAPGLRFRGFAWGENVGWLNLDDTTHFVSVNCNADLTTTAVPGSPGYGIPNGILNNDDFFYFLSTFSQNVGCTTCPFPPDLTTSAVPGSLGFGVPNNILNNDDFFFYLSLFASGCP